MPPKEPQSTSVKLSELIVAFESVSASDGYEHKAYICKRTGRIIIVSEGMDLEEETEVPDEPDLADYHVVPHRRDLDLGKRLALSFVAQELPGLLNKAREIFHRKGAYGRFKQLLHTTGSLDKWYAFEERATEEALLEWCDEAGVTLNDNERPS